MPRTPERVRAAALRGERQRLPTIPLRPPPPPPAPPPRRNPRTRSRNNRPYLHAGRAYQWVAEADHTVGASGTPRRRLLSPKYFCHYVVASCRCKFVSQLGG